MTTKIALTNIADTALATLTGPKVTTIVYPGDDTATDTAGGQTINLTGNGFQSGCSVLVGSTAASVVTFISTTQISFTAPVQTAGTYVIYVINPDGGTAISIPGISYSGTPNWSTSAGTLGTAYETGAISATLTATGDAPITYSLVTGTLPTGSTLNSNGTISGTAVATASITTYSFTIKATDAQNQDTNRAFSLTINPDVVTWSSPANLTTYSVSKDVAIANVTMSATSAAGGSITYTADTLPTGLSITGANIAGTPTVVASITTTLTATATSTRTATRTINWVVTVANDTYFKYTSLLLNGETTVTPFISDASTNSFGLTIQGDTKPVTFNPYQGDGYYSNYFDGTGDQLLSATSANLALQSSDFTVELWYYPTGKVQNYPVLISNGNFNTNKWQINDRHQAFPTKVSVNMYAGSSGDGWLVSTTAISVNAWYHVALVRSGSTFTLYINGVSEATNTYVGSITASTDFITLGQDQNQGVTCYTGYISNARIVKGTAVYTSNFTPSTTPLTAIANTSLLTCQSNRLIDNSTNNFAITKAGDTTISPNIPFTANASYSTYGSTYFDGTGDYLTIAGTSTACALPGDFTIECWYYQNTSSALFYGTIFSTTATYATTNSLRISTGQNNNTIQVASAGSGVLNASVTFTPYTWVHLALVRSGTTLTLYQNGVSVGSATNSQSFVSDTFIIGDTQGSGAPYCFNGYMSNFRVVKGTAVYTTSFTPPTSPLTAIANTSLLTLQYNGGATNQGIIDNSNFNNIITRNGNTSQGTFSPYSVTGWSNYFGAATGSGTNLLTAYSANLVLSADFTIECWIFPIVNGGMILNLGGGSNIAWASYEFAWDGTYVNFAASSANSGYDIGSETGTTGRIGAPTLNAWNHIAVTRSGNNYRGYLNGTLGYSQTLALSPYDPATRGLAIGGHYSNTWNSGTPVNSVAGYISNLRIIKGTALYSGSSLTVPTTPLTAVSGTSILACQSNRFIDNSPKNLALTINGTPTVQAYSPFGSISEATPISYSNYFNNGTTEYLSLTTPVFQHTADFTYECWVYWNGTVPSDWPMIFDTRPSNTSQSTSIACNINPSTYRLNFYLGGTNYYWGATALPSNSWVHVAVVRSSGTVKIYQNGVLGTDTASNSSTFSGATGMRIGANIGNMGYWPGYISNFRVTNTAVYTAAFTPSTTALTAIANTSLLTCQSTTIVDNSSNALTITASGSPKVYKYNPFGYTTQSATSYTPSLHGGSIYLDGSTGYMTAPLTPYNFAPAGNFTIESWVYLTGVIASGPYYILSNWPSGSIPAQTFNFGVNTSGYLLFYAGISSTQLQVIGSSQKVSLNAWSHVAISRSGSTFKIFVNGTQDSTTATNSGALNVQSTSYKLGIGHRNDSGGYAFGWPGYISDLRFSDGIAIYTSNFIPPSQTLTNYSTSYPSQLLLNFNNGGIIDQHGTNVLETVGNAQLSTAVKKYNNASMSFNGSSQYLSIPNNTLWALGTEDFTIEFWVYFNAFPSATWLVQLSQYVDTSNRVSIFFGNNAALENGLVFKVVTSSTIYKAVENDSASITMASLGYSTSTWYHVAITRSGSTIKGFINGTQKCTTTTSATFPILSAPLLIGSFTTTPELTHNGYIDDLRITKGYARYTTTFTPPTSALITK